MRKLISLIRAWFADYFDLRYFVAIACFTAALIYVNYKFSLEERYITFEPDTTLRLFRYCLMYLTALGGAYALQVFDRRNRAIWSWKLWAMILFAVLLFSVRAWFDQYDRFTQVYVPVMYQTVVDKYIINLQGFIFLFIPCFIYWLFIDRRIQPVYGFHSKGVILKPHFILLLLMVPLLLAASTQQDFLQTYPRAFHLDLPPGKPGNGWLTFLYEICYSADFICTEFFFRGFLILAFMRYAGPRVVLPMCVFYVSIHFDKPLGEAIGSFFGGWILGILAYETRSIYGGIIVHLGFALLMEIVALAAHLI